MISRAARNRRSSACAIPTAAWSPGSSKIVWTRGIPMHPISPITPSPNSARSPAADGQALHYRLFKPAHFDPAKRYPAIVEVYGGPGVQRVLDNWTGARSRRFSRAPAMSSFSSTIAAAPRAERRFRRPIHGRLGEIEVADQVRGARWLGSQSYVDASRIGVWGWSYGGYMTLMLMFRAPGGIRGRRLRGARHGLDAL